jgi:hypothetical protein
MYNIRPIPHLSKIFQSLLTIRSFPSNLKMTSDLQDQTQAEPASPNYPKYMFGIQGKTLRRNISLAGAFGFLLFGYDQGFIGVRAKWSSRILEDLAKIFELQGLIAQDSFLQQFNYPSSGLLGTITAIYE